MRWWRQKVPKRRFLIQADELQHQKKITLVLTVGLNSFTSIEAYKSGRNLKQHIFGSFRNFLLQVFATLEATAMILAKVFSHKLIP